MEYKPKLCPKLRKENMPKTFHEHICRILRAFNVEEFDLLVPDELIDTFVVDIDVLVAIFSHRI